MLKSNASIHHWNEIQMLTIDKLNNNKKVHRTQNCLCIFIRKDEAMVVAVQEYLSGQKNHENKTKILTEKEEKKKSNRQPMNTTISIYRLLMDHFFAYIFCSHFFAHEAFLCKKTLNKEKVETEEESKTCLSDFDKLFWDYKCYRQLCKLKSFTFISVPFKSIQKLLICLPS